MMILRVILIVALTLVMACGDGPSKKAPLPTNNLNGATNNGATNNGATNNGATNNGATNNGATNNGATNNVVTGPCARLDATELAFGGTLVETSVTRTITLSNCSQTEPLEIESVSLSGEGFEASIVSEAVAAPGGVIQIDVTFSPFEIAAYDAFLSVAHSASDDPEVIELSGQGTDMACVTSVARVRNASTGGSFGSSVTLMPGEMVELDGAESSSPVGEVIFNWSILSQPGTSGASLSNNSSAAPVFTPDVPGDYRVQLLATDTAGSEPCNVAEVSITVASNNGGGTSNISLQLVWETPGDATPGDDIGTDLDIHWLRQSGMWNQAPYDCFWDNRAPDWGVTNDETDDPSLDIDDSAGEGPENINHSNLEPGIVYSAGVYYYNDVSLGATYATIRLYENNVLVHESTDKFLGRTGDFWHAIDFSTTNGVVLVDQVQQGFP